MSAFSPSFGFLLFARGLVGFGLGGVPVAYSMFMEFLPSSGRGVWLTVIEVFWTLGSVAEAGLAWARSRRPFHPIPSRVYSRSTCRIKAFNSGIIAIIHNEI